MKPELKDFEVYKPFGKNIVHLFVTIEDWSDSDMNSEILAEYEIQIFESYSDRITIKKEYNEKLNLTQRQACDDKIEELYESNYFEDEYIQEYNDEECSWFI